MTGPGIGFRPDLHGNFIRIVTKVLRSAVFQAVQNESETLYLIGIEGFFGRESWI
jgi:hypothetical protein